MSIFGKRSRPAPAAVVNDAPVHVYLVHYVEHDKVITINAPDMPFAIRFAREHMHVFTTRPDVYTRPMMYDNERICVMLYGDDHEYTCNIILMNVHDHVSDATNTLMPA